MPELSAALATAPTLLDPIATTDTLAVVRGSPPPSLYTVSQQRLLAGLATASAHLTAPGISVADFDAMFPNATAGT